MHAITPVMVHIDTEESKVPVKKRRMNNDGTTECTTALNIHVYVFRLLAIELHC